jgi:hypothetical protein
MRMHARTRTHIIIHSSKRMSDCNKSLIKKVQKIDRNVSSGTFFFDVMIVYF